MFDLKFTGEEKVQYSKYIIRMLLPFLKQFNEEQMREKQIEANIQGMFLDFKISVALIFFFMAEFVWDSGFVGKKILFNMNNVLVSCMSSFD